MWSVLSRWTQTIKIICTNYWLWQQYVSKIEFNYTFWWSNEIGSVLNVFRFLYVFFPLVIVTYINLRSTKLFTRINNFCSFGKVVACVIVIVGGIYELCQGNSKNLSSGFEGTTTDPGNIALAFFNGLWAYDGWVSVTLVTEELKDPSK